MKQSDLKAFAQHMSLLQEIFSPDKSVSKEKVEVYFRAFKDIDIEQFKQACEKIIKTKKISTFPLPAEIREALNGDIQVRAYLALQIVEKTVDNYGPYFSIMFDDPLIHAVIDRLGGWEWLTTQKYDEWKWIRKDFVKLYEIYSRFNPSQIEAPKRLPGICERENEDFEKNKKLKHMIIYIEERKLLEQ